MLEGYAVWDPTCRINAPCGSAEVTEPGGGSLIVRLAFSEVVDGIAEDLLITFTSHVALMSHEEFAHPWCDDGELALPTIGGKWGRATHPTLRVNPSAWIESFSGDRLAHVDRRDVQHYRFVTLDRTVDVLATETPALKWTAARPHHPGAQ